MQELTEYFHSGGLVMWPLLLSTLLLWYSLGYRVAVMRRCVSRRHVRRLVEDYRLAPWQESANMLQDAVQRAQVLIEKKPVNPRRQLEQLLWPYQRQMKKFDLLIKTIVYSAPLLGLLGTVSGMIETFDSLQDMTLFSQSGGIASGISQALITTQLGLAIAIPGVLINGVLEKQRLNMNMELDQLVDIICSK